jgi:hypothetical protein
MRAIAAALALVEGVVILSASQAQGQLIDPVSQLRTVSASGRVTTNNDGATPYGYSTNTADSAVDFGPWDASVSAGNNYLNPPYGFTAIGTARQQSAISGSSITATGGASSSESNTGWAHGGSQFNVTFDLTDNVTYTISCTLYGPSYPQQSFPGVTLSGPTGTVFQASIFFNSQSFSQSGILGPGQYSIAASAAVADTGFGHGTSESFGLTFTVIPEPSTLSLACMSISLLSFFRRPKRSG